MNRFRFCDDDRHTQEAYKRNKGKLIEENPYSDLSEFPDEASLFIGDLSRTVTEEMLEKMFSDCGDLECVDIKRDKVTKNNLGYGFVKFRDRRSAEIAKHRMNGMEICGRAIRIGWAQKNTNLFVCLVGDTRQQISGEQLRKIFSAFGPIYEEDTFVKRNKYGFVKFKHRAHAEKAKANLDNSHLALPNGGQTEKPVRIGWGDANTQRNCVHVQFEQQSACQVDLKEDDFESIFIKFGQVNKVSLPRYSDKRLKGYGFIHFEENDYGEESAARAITELTGSEIKGVAIMCNFGKRQNQRHKRFAQKNQNQEDGMDGYGDEMGMKSQNQFGMGNMNNNNNMARNNNNNNNMMDENAMHNNNNNNRFAINPMQQLQQNDNSNMNGMMGMDGGMGGMNPNNPNAMGQMMNPMMLQNLMHTGAFNADPNGNPMMRSGINPMMMPPPNMANMANMIPSPTIPMNSMHGHPHGPPHMPLPPQLMMNTIGGHPPPHPNHLNLGNNSVNVSPQIMALHRMPPSPPPPQPLAPPPMLQSNNNINPQIMNSIHMNMNMNMNMGNMNVNVNNNANNAENVNNAEKQTNNKEVDERRNAENPNSKEVDERVKANDGNADASKKEANGGGNNVNNGNDNGQMKMMQEMPRIPNLQNYANAPPHPSHLFAMPPPNIPPPQPPTLNTPNHGRNPMIPFGMPGMVNPMLNFPNFAPPNMSPTLRPNGNNMGQRMEGVEAHMNRVHHMGDFNPNKLISNSNSPQLTASPPHMFMAPPPPPNMIGHPPFVNGFPSPNMAQFGGLHGNPNLRRPASPTPPISPLMTNLQVPFQIPSPQMVSHNASIPPLNIGGNPMFHGQGIPNLNNKFGQLGLNKFPGPPIHNPMMMHHNAPPPPNAFRERQEMLNQPPPTANEINEKQLNQNRQ